jgi:hypothetical protein
MNENISMDITDGAQIAQWPNETGQRDKQRSTKHAHKTKDRVTPLKTESELMCSGRVSPSCSTSGTRRVNLVNVLCCLYSLPFSDLILYVLN